MMYCSNTTSTCTGSIKLQVCTLAFLGEKYVRDHLYSSILLLQVLEYRSYEKPIVRRCRAMMYFVREQMASACVQGMSGVHLNYDLRLKKEKIIVRNSNKAHYFAILKFSDIFVCYSNPKHFV